MKVKKCTVAELMRIQECGSYPSGCDVCREVFLKYDVTSKP